MNRRLLLIGFLVGASLTTFFVGFLLVAIAISSGRVDTGLILQPFFVLFGLLILIGAVLRAPRPHAPKQACVQCGNRVFQTRRTLDNGLLWSCFNCGWESPASRGARRMMEPSLRGPGGPHEHV